MARILVIDDEDNIRKMVRLALEQVGHVVDEAAGGSSGIAKFIRGEDWDVVILDQRMPGMGGVEVLRYLKERSASVHVVFMTAYGTMDLALDVMEGGAASFLRKPFGVDALRGAVSAAMLNLAIVSHRVSSGPVGSRFGLTTLNGFLMEPLRMPVRRKRGEVEQTIAVREPNGNLTPCVVVLGPPIVASIPGDATPGAGHDNDRMWRGLAEAALAEHLWRTAGIPMGGVLRISDVTPELSRWVEAVAPA
jgi:CheY-like chemotaxis protein